MKRSRHSTTPTDPKYAHKIPRLTERDRRILGILDPNNGHRFLPTNWIAYHFPEVKWKDELIKRLGHLKLDGNEWLKWSGFPLNIELVNTRHGIYELSPKGAAAIGITLPKYRRMELAHEFLIALYECSLKFQARKLGLEFSFLDPLEYKLPSGKTWLPDGHSIDIDGVLIHSEIERRAYNESPIHTSEKIDKAIEYIQGRHYQAEGYSSSLVFFVSTSGSRTSTLMEYVNKKTNGKCSFIGFATTQDWAHAPHMPPPEIPLTPEFQRVGYPPLTLNNLKGETHV